MDNSQTHKQPTPGLLPVWVGKLWMWIFGWSIAGEVPDGKKFVFIAAPHTSNWDFTFMLAVAAIFKIRVSWMGKDSLFKKPFGGFMRWLGGIPIDRSRNRGIVAQMVELFENSDELSVVIPPSGTRSKDDHWKSGFYRIANGAQVPVVCTYLDFKHKEAGVGLSFVPTGNVTADMDRIREFYEGIAAKYPEQASRIRLREEGE